MYLLERISDIESQYWKVNGLWKVYRLIAQIESSSGSVMDNMAERFGKNGNKESVQFLYIAKESCGEQDDNYIVQLS